MTQITKTIRTLGSLGLLERLDEETRDAGISHFQLLIDLIKNRRHTRVQGIGDDFIPKVKVYNTVGAIYPSLSREYKDKVIKAHLTVFDDLDYTRVNTNHTPYIRDPQLLADIDIVSPIYWPGLLNEEKLWREETSFKRLQKKIIDKNGLFNKEEVRSDFLVAYGLIKLTKFGNEYVTVANPQFLDRVIKGIVSLKFARKTTDQEIDEGINKLYELLPKVVHKKIRPLMQEAD